VQVGFFESITHAEEACILFLKSVGTTEKPRHMRRLCAWVREELANRTRFDSSKKASAVEGMRREKELQTHQAVEPPSGTHSRDQQELHSICQSGNHGREDEDIADPSVETSFANRQSKPTEKDTCIVPQPADVLIGVGAMDTNQGNKDMFTYAQCLLGYYGSKPVPRHVFTDTLQTSVYQMDGRFLVRDHQGKWVMADDKQVFAMCEEVAKRALYKHSLRIPLRTVQQREPDSSSSVETAKIIPQPHDVLIGHRSKKSHQGNRDLKAHAALIVPELRKCKNQPQKSVWLGTLAQAVHERGGRFLWYCKGVWYVASRQQMQTMCRSMADSALKQAKSVDGQDTGSSFCSANGRDLFREWPFLS